MISCEVEKIGSCVGLPGNAPLVECRVRCTDGRRVTAGEVPLEGDTLCYHGKPYGFDLWGLVCP